MDLGFALNYQFVYLIDTNPTGAEDWAFLGPGVESFTNDRADTTVDKAYWDKGGATSTNVTAVTSGWTVAGDRLIGDKAQDYIVGLTYLKGAERKTRVRQVGPDGEAVEWPCTIVEIKGAGADGNTPDNVPFGCSIKCEGDPVLVQQAAGAELPESVTVEDVEVGGQHCRPPFPSSLCLPAPVHVVFCGFFRKKVRLEGLYCYFCRFMLKFC